MQETKCPLCNFNLTVGASNGPHEEKMTYFDFVVKKEHSFVRNIFDSDELSAFDEIKTLENFKLFLQIVLLLNNTYAVESGIKDISDDCIANFVEKNEIESVQDPYLEIANTEIKNGEIKFYKAVDELESLIKNDGRNIVRKQHTKQVQHFDQQNGRGRKKIGRRPTITHKIFETNSTFQVK